MKKTYVKPLAAVEFYALSQSIAGCGIAVGLLDNKCVVSDSDTPDETRSFALIYPNYFSSSCYTDASNIQQNDSLCYHTQVAALFTS